MPPGIRCSRKWLVLGVGGLEPGQGQGQGQGQLQDQGQDQLQRRRCIGGRLGRWGWVGRARCKYVRVSSVAASMRLRALPTHPHRPPTHPRCRIASRARSRTRAASCARTGGRSSAEPCSAPPYPPHNLTPSPRTNPNRPASEMHWPAPPCPASGLALALALTQGAPANCRASARVGLRGPEAHGCADGAYKGEDALLARHCLACV